MLVYPVPVKGAFVLGVHSTLTVSGHIKIGPTVFPAFSLENYDGLENLTLKGVLDCAKGFVHVAKSPKTRALIQMFLATELRKSISITTLITEASKYQSYGEASPAEIVKNFEFYKAGIRSQLFDVQKGELLNDFLLETDTSGSQLHLLNVVSQGWTCAMPFTRWVVDTKLAHL